MDKPLRQAYDYWQNQLSEVGIRSRNDIDGLFGIEQTLPMGQHVD
jgi:hypothetical protein